MSKQAYVGSFPPPYGGVTVKNALLFDGISSRLEIEQIDLSRVKQLRPIDVVHFIHEMISPAGALVIGTSDFWRQRITLFLYRANRDKMRQSIVFVMGGARLDDVRYADALSCYKTVYVETDGMRQNYESMGLNNVRIFPNCRKRPKESIAIAQHQGRLACVYFSLVSEEKGALLVLDAAKALPDVDFHMYGRIDPTIESHFIQRCDELDNVAYHGVFDSVKDDVIAELSQYDVHLFPSKYPNEGVPGVLVETKIAGIPTIAFDRCHNDELIQDGETGFVLVDDSIDSFLSAISKLDADRQKLVNMKRATLESAEHFYVESYLDEIVDVLGG